MTIAVAQPVCVPGAVGQNATRHGELVRAAGARVVVFPELSLTGYELDAAVPVATDDPALAPLVRACADTGSIALAGAPTREPSGCEHIAVLAVSGRGARIAYRKTWLGGQEQRRFAPGGGPASYQVDGWRLGLAVCKDTSVPAHAGDTAALGIDVYVAGLVMSRDEAAEQDARAQRIARQLSSYVAFASFAGPTGSGYPDTAGRSGIWAADGTVLAQAGSAPDELATATLR